MSLKSEDTRLSDDPVENSDDLERKSKITYTRDFLLSLSGLDACKKLPDGFDHSILSEFEDAAQDRHRVTGSFSSHFRRTEYGSSPPTRGELGNNSRGIHGRWDSRSSGRSDKESDSQPGLESESGRRYGSQPRRPWQAPEHDGLLGSGSFPRPPGFATGSSVPKSRANEHYHLNKSSEPYHPPRPYKAAPHQRRETTTHPRRETTHDSYNDETFGSLDATSEDRAEEERKRRASFELMRKEQVKAIHEKQKLNIEKRKDGFDITTLLEDSSDKKRIIDKSGESDQPVKEPAVIGITEKSSLTQGPSCRPLVPPGFKNSAPEKDTGMKLPSQPDVAEIINPQSEDNHLVNMTHSSLSSRTNHDQENKQSGEKLVFREQQAEISSNIISTDSDSHVTSQFTAPVKAVETTELKELEELRAHNSAGNPSSIIERLFGSALNDGNSTADQHLGSGADEIWSPRAVRSSKFAQWFMEEDQNPVEDLSSGQTNNLLSLIIGGEKGESMASNSRAIKPFAANAPFQDPELPDMHITSSMTSCITGNNLEQLYGEDKQNTTNAFLTCEDLEQKMLLEASKSGPNSSPMLQGWSTGANIELPKAAIDDQASHHLLSLLQKGTGQKNMAPSFNLDVGASADLHKIEGEVNTSANSLSKEDSEINPKLGKTLTLETLFGNAFMTELQSVRAPVSVQRGSSGSVGGGFPEPAGFPFSITENSLASSVHASHESPVPNLIEKINPGGVEEQYIGFHNSGMIADPLHLQINSGSKPDGSGNSVETQHPEDNSLFKLGDPVNRQSLSSANSSADIVGKLASLNSALRDGIPNTQTQDGVPLLHAPYDSRGSDLVRTPELNHGGQMFYTLPSHSANVNPQMNFMSPDVIDHNPPSNQFSADAFRPPFHHPPSGVTAFDQSSHHRMLQQMQVPGSFPPPHLLRGIPPGVPLYPHPSNQMAAFMAELSPAQRFPSSHQRPNHDGPVPMLAPQLGGSSNNPEALQRLIEMELRSRPKQIHPFAPAGHSQLDMGFGYR